MGKVAVSLAFVHEQEEHHTGWRGPATLRRRRRCCRPVAADPQTVLVGVRNAVSLIAAHA
jgi:hypothetical protein